MAMHPSQEGQPAGRRHRVSGGRAVSLAFVVGLALTLAFAATGCAASSDDPEVSEPTQSEAPPQSETPAEQTEPPAVSPTPAPAAALQIEDVRVGTGPEAKPGNNVMVHYTGWLADGSKFDSSRDSGQPFPFRIGAGEVIPGWDQGVAGMKVGGIRKLTIPPDLAYGPGGYPPVIPGNATLVFEVELLSVN